MPPGTERFHDRCSAGKALALALQKLPIPSDALVLGLARGGLPVAAEVARALYLPLDALLVRKVGMPGQPEFALGAVASGGIVVRDAADAGLAPGCGPSFEQLVQREQSELTRREQIYRRGSPSLSLARRHVVLIDDGLATGSTMLAAVRAARAAEAASVIVAAPVASHEAVERLAREADRVVVLKVPPLFMAVGEWYESFEQVEDKEVQALLETFGHRA